MKKRKAKSSLFVATVTSITMLTGCVGGVADKSVGTTSADGGSENAFKPDSTNVMSLGRTYYKDGKLWCAWSGSGAAFRFSGTKAEITITGDSSAIRPSAENKARIAIYADGKLIVDDIIDRSEKKYTVFENESVVDSEVRVVKLSESAMSTFAIKEIYVESESDVPVSPVAQKPYYIEFVGDSITCGYGVDDEVKDHHFSTETENVTKSYAYLTAEKLNADYSMVSISGYGIISGYSDDGQKKTPDDIVTKYYKTLGYSVAGFANEKPADIQWDFSKRQPDIVVINLGTNDDSYCGNDPARKAEFTAAYVDFLKTVRECNPKAHIVCSLGIMGTRLYPAVEEAYVNYSKETGDEKITVYRFDPQDGSLGYAADWHPSAATHQKAAEGFAEELRKYLE